LRGDREKRGRRRTDGNFEVASRDVAEEREVRAALDDGEALVLVRAEETFCRVE